MNSLIAVFFPNHIEDKNKIHLGELIVSIILHSFMTTAGWTRLTRFQAGCLVTPYIVTMNIIFQSTFLIYKPSLSWCMRKPRHLIKKQLILLVPSLQTILAVEFMRTLLPLRPPHPRRLGITHNADHLLRNGQIGINRRCKWMDQFRPVMIPQPQHGTANGAEVAFGWTAFFVTGAAIFDSGVFSSPC